MHASFLLLLLVHPVHETVAEVEWNSMTHRMEVALRLDALDAQWLSKQAVTNKQGQSWRLAYLRQRFRVTDTVGAGQSETSAYHWIGREQKGAHVWWYFEIEPTNGRKPQWIQQRMLGEREPNYTHRILILGESGKRSLNLSSQKTKARFDQSHDDTTSRATDR